MLHFPKIQNSFFLQHHSVCRNYFLIWTSLHYQQGDVSYASSILKISFMYKPQSELSRSDDEEKYYLSLTYEYQSVLRKISYYMHYIRYAILVFSKSLFLLNLSQTFIPICFLNLSLNHMLSKEQNLKPPLSHIHHYLF